MNHRRRRPGNASDRDPARLADLLDSISGGHGIARTSVLTTVLGSWGEVVGDDVAHRTRPVELRDGTLVIEVDDPGWATQLRFMTTQIAARVDELVGAGTVRTVRFRPIRG